MTGERRALCWRFAARDLRQGRTHASPTAAHSSPGFFAPASGCSVSGFATVRAHVPASELITYPIDLRSATHGAGSFTRTFAGYEPVPDR